MFPDVRNVPLSSSRVQGSSSLPKRPAIPNKTVAENLNFEGIVLNLLNCYLPAEVLNIILVFKCGNNVEGTRGDVT
jgi:hypothetical protein